MAAGRLTMAHLVILCFTWSSSAYLVGAWTGPSAFRPGTLTSPRMMTVMPDDFAPPVATFGVPDERVLQTTIQWVQDAVVGLNLCPFAEAPLRAGAIRVAITRAETVEDLLGCVDVECAGLLATPEEDVATTLVVAPHLDIDFVAFHHSVAGLEDEDILEEAFPGYADRIMVVCFHPHHAWAGVPENDALNYEKRAPFPIVNLLRTTMVDKAIQAGLTVDIAERNQARLRLEGIEKLQAVYAQLRATAAGNSAEHSPKT
mmetsp:Transcript_19887/g.53563  ORF Transcript_19887/g.53563 Transcript_19887/m.53563 type:complete len:259 (-) Transcript_19887:142-918(-)